MKILPELREKVKFNKNELSGAFGDIGTDLPLIIGIIQVSGADVASVLFMFGLMNVLTGLIYGIPMAVQPLKAMAVIVISQKISADVLLGGGFAIAVIMFVITISGLLDILSKIIPKVAIRGIQFGLGLSLVSVSAQKYLCSNSISEYILATISIILLIILRENKRLPAALAAIIIGIVYASIFSLDFTRIVSNVGISFPVFKGVGTDSIIEGLFLLALPQLPLSLSNSIFATHQTIKDLFPEKSVSVRKIGFTYSLMNLIGPLFGGIPTCHGSGGLVGQHYFGGRTGGSVVIYGSIYVILGIFFSGVFLEVVKIFPFPVLGAILLFEGLALMMLIKDIVSEKDSLFIALFTGIIAAFIKYGFVIGLIGGTILHYFIKQRFKNYLKE